MAKWSLYIFKVGVTVLPVPLALRDTPTILTAETTILDQWSVLYL